ncbi:MAG: hypothetical protein OEV92_05205 [Nitrospinota bacterium]|nr:hypothetical protein [Nitrospinota bacterium]
MQASDNEKGESQAPRPRARIFRNALRWAAIFAIGAGLALAVALFLLDRWLKSPALAPYLAQSISQAMGGQASVGMARGGLFEDIALEDVRLTTADGLELEIPKAMARLNLTALAHFTFTIDSVRISHPRIILRPKPGQQKPEPSVSQGPSSTSQPPSLPLNIRLGKLEIDNIEVSIIQPESAIAMKGISIGGSGRADKDGPQARLSITADPGARLNYSAAETKASGALEGAMAMTLEKNWMATLQGALKADIETLALHGLRKPGAAELKIEATTSLFGAPRGDCAIQGRLYGNPVLDISSNWTGGEDDPQIKFNVQARKMEVALRDFSSLLERAGVKAAGSARVVEAAFAGFMKNGMINGVGSGNIQLILERFDGLGVKAPGKTELSLAAKNLLVAGTKISGDLSAEASTQSLELAGVKADQMKVTASANLDNQMRGQVSLLAQAENLFNDGRDFGQASLTAMAEGDLKSGAIEMKKGELTLKDSLALTMAGRMAGFGQDSLIGKLKARISAGSRLLAMIPEKKARIQAGALALEMDVEGGLGKDLAVRITSETTGLKMTVVEGGIGLQNIGARLDAGFRLASGGAVNHLKARLTTQGGRIALEKASIGEPEITAEISADSIGEGIMEFSLKADSPSMALTGAATGSAPFPVRVAAQGSVDTAKQNYNLKESYIDLGPLATAKATGRAGLSNGIFAMDAQVFGLNLGQVWGLVPTALTAGAGLEKLEGIVHARLAGQGIMPKTIEQIGYPLPFKGSFSATLEDGKFARAGLDVTGLKAAIGAVVDGKSDKAYADIRAVSVDAPQTLGQGGVDAALEIDLRMTGKDRIDIARLVASSAELGVVESAQGYIDNLDIPTLGRRLSENPAALLGQLGGTLENYVMISMEKSRRFLGSLEASGRLDSSIMIGLDPGKTLNVNGEAEFVDLSVSKGGESVIRNLRGRFPFEKSLAIWTGGAMPPAADTAGDSAPAKQARDTTFFDDIRGAPTGRESVAMDYLKAGPVELFDSDFDLFLRQNSFGTGYYRTRLLGGGLTGSLMSRSSGGEVSLRLNNIFAGLDLGKMTGGRLGVAGKEGEVDGAINLEAGFSSGAGEALDITNITLIARITRIDAKALDRLLLFFDPKEDSPSIMSARAALKLANPVKVDLTARHGALSLSIDMQYSPALGGKKITMPVIKRAQVASLARFESIREVLAQLAPLRDGARIIGASTLVVGEDGTVSLK